MGNWEVLIVPLIALGVWILSTLFRGEEDQRGKPRRPAGDAGPAPPRRPVSDLDRFLEEARRRREASEKVREPARAAPVAEAPRPRPAVPVARAAREAPPRPARPVQPSATRRPMPEPARPMPATRSPEPRLRVEPEVVPVEVLPPTAPPPPPPAPAPATARARRPVSPVLTQVAALLRTPQAAGVAVVLREIFDRPLCQRHRG